MDYILACKSACDYFYETLKIEGLAVATENSDKWFFSAGKDSTTRIGNIIISLQKSNGAIEIVDILSEEGYREVKNSTAIDIPSEFRSK